MHTEDKMTVLVVEPEKAPYIAEIGTDLESMQKAVGGFIEAVYPYEEPVCLIVNEEGKLDGLPLNRALRDADGEIYDITAGTMLVAGLGDEDFCSLTESQIKEYSEKFLTPEQFIRLNGKILAIPMEIKEPEKETNVAPVYRYPAAYATEHNQLEAYRDSMKQNIACKGAIESSIAANYRNNRLDKSGAAGIVEEYGAERVQYVLASTIRHMNWDERYSQDNKAWAKTVPIYENKDPWGQDRNNAFLITQAHPGLIDLFASQVRRLEKVPAKERTSVMEKLQNSSPSSHKRIRKEKEPER